MTGGGKTLILAAQSDADLKANKQNTRYVVCTHGTRHLQAVCL